MRKQRAMGSPPIILTLLLLFSLPLWVGGCLDDEPPREEVPFVLAGTLVENSEYADRRQRLMDEIPDGIAIIPGATAQIAGDQFFQSNDFLYFTGVEAPDAWLIVDGVNRESTLFLTLDEHDARGEGIPPELATGPEG